MDDSEELPVMESVDPGMRQILGMFDVPAFARRGQDLEFAVGRLHARCRRERLAMLEMVRMRLRQWAAAVEGADAWQATFADPIDYLWADSEAEPPRWATSLALPRRRRTIARDLIQSVLRFNARWQRFVAGLNLDPINALIDQYNRYYVLEKECVLGSARLAARHFEPRPLLSRAAIEAGYPLLPTPTLRTIQHPIGGLEAPAT
jgi:hypothetical protein